PPSRPVVERARAETGRDAAGEDRCGRARTDVLGRQDERDAEADRGVEAELVEHPSQLRLHTLGRRDHRLSLGPVWSSRVSRARGTQRGPAGLASRHRSSSADAGTTTARWSPLRAPNGAQKWAISRETARRHSQTGSFGHRDEDLCFAAAGSTATTGA